MAQPASFLKELACIASVVALLMSATANSAHAQEVAWEMDEGLTEDGDPAEDYAAADPAAGTAALMQAEVRVIPPSGIETDPGADPAMLKALREPILPVVERAQLPTDTNRIESGTLPVMTADSVGLSQADPNQEPVDARFALQQILVLPVALPSPILRQLAAQHVMAEWPLKEQAPGQEIVPGSLLSARVTQLIAWGYLPEAERLLAQVPPSMQSDEVAWAGFLLALVKDESTQACEQAATGGAAYSTERWRYATIYCHALEGRSDEAQLGMDMLAEQSQQPDALFREVITAMKLKKPMRRAAIPANPGLWEQLMLVQVVAKQPLLDSVKQLATPLLKKLSEIGDMEPVIRQAANKELERRSARVATGEWLTPARIAYGADAGGWEQREANRTYAILNALNIPLDPTAQAQWSEQLARPASGAALPQAIAASPEGLAYLDIAQRKGDKRSVVFAAVNLLTADTAEMEDATVLRIITALQQTGMDAEARQFAAESIAAVGVQVKQEKAAAKKTAASLIPQDNLSRPSPGARTMKTAPQPQG